MECRAKISNIARSFKDSDIILTLNISGASDTELQDLSQCERLTLKLTQYKPKRSLNANAYLWVLMDKLASMFESTSEEVYEEMLQKYGTLALDDDGMPYTLTVKASVDMSKIDGHFKFYKESSDGKWKSYFVILGSSQYNSAEMTRLLDGVISECKEVGIETIPPDEYERMMERYGAK